MRASRSSGAATPAPASLRAAMAPFRAKFTHHEAGTLWMGDDPSVSVTDPNCRFHGIRNVYVAGPALFPTIGSPNPMLTGIALVRRLGDHLLPPPPIAVAEDGFKPLFDGKQKSKDLFTNWLMAGGGGFT